jgi:hypothetical protein
MTKLQCFQPQRKADDAYSTHNTCKQTPVLLLHTGKHGNSVPVRKQQSDYSKKGFSTNTMNMITSTGLQNSYQSLLLTG